MPSSAAATRQSAAAPMIDKDTDSEHTCGRQRAVANQCQATLVQAFDLEFLGDIQMRRRQSTAGGDLLAGTLDMLILRSLQPGPVHGLGIAQQIERRSDDVLLVEQGSLYPALYRLEERG